MKELEFVQGNIKKGYRYQQANAMQQMQDSLDAVKDDLMGFLDEQSQHQYEQQSINNISTTTMAGLEQKLQDITSRLISIETKQC